ncbi:hypothetical protein DNU06_11360 [Putridiphycobacter roseus]|uniref:SCP domain-containing protein n=1 Tax=Putridiphycobacter roseus TaxID=2219161 RepID=A0A2W1MYC3_9FLAO|nr:CAP domain-containing protein [Putridiphycobacter roseus]PZE16847.1 hypothetical protein DNU06_11360 [Putridiphycobacter roseus]
MKILSVLYIFMSLCVHAQVNGENTILDLEKIDKKLLNLLLIDYTNELRGKRKKDTLSNYPSLSKAARYHAKYMGYYQYIGHHQQRKGYRTVKERLISMGGDANFVGENVQMVPLTSWVKNSKTDFTYGELAEKLGENWRKSKGHYNNMINEHYTGVYHGFYFIDGNLYACQVFSSKPFEPKFDYIPGPDLIVKDKEPCLNCKQTDKKILDEKIFVGWYTLSNDSIYYENLKRVSNAKSFGFFGKTFQVPLYNYSRKNIGNKNGVIAVDVIHQTQFSCIGDENFSSKLYAEGYHIGNVDKKKMKLENISKNPAFYKVYVGQLPAFKDPYFQIDYHLIKKKKPCAVYSIIYVKPDYLTPWEYFNIKEPVKSQDNRYTLTDSILLKIPFESGKVDEDPQVFTELIQELQNVTQAGFAIQQIHFTGIASIEGNKNGNKALILRRAAAINKIIAANYSGLNISTEYNENFDDFRTGLALSGQRSWADSSDLVLRNFANKNSKNKEVKELLDQSRQSEVLIVFQKQFTDTVLMNPTIQKLYAILAEENTLNATLTFQVLANIALKTNDSLLLADLLAVPIPENDKWGEMMWDQLVLKQKVKHDPITPIELKKIYDFGGIKDEVTYLEYRLMYNLFQDNNAFDVSDFDKVYAGLKVKKTQNWLQALKIISEDLDYDQTETFNLKLVQLAIKGRFDQFQTYFVSQYLIRYQYLNEAKLLLKRYAKRKQQFPKLYRQYLKLSYYFKEFEKENEFKRNLNIFKNLLQVSDSEFCKLFEWREMGVRILKYKQLAELFCENCRTSS